MNTESYIKDKLSELFATQKVAVVATQSNDQPYTSLVAFAASLDFKKLYFVTQRATRKLANIHLNPRIAVMIDNRTNKDSDIHNAIGVTITGTSRQLRGDERQQALTYYLAKHPHMEEFATATSSVLIEVIVEHYYIVTHFQKVVELHVEK